MFMIAQVPFVDFRLLSTGEFTDCMFPNTFGKTIGKPVYYRYFGDEKNRYEPLELPLAERQFFDARKILHIDGSRFQGTGLYYPTLLFSRLFEDGQFFHFDIGVRETLKNNINRRDLNKFLKDFLRSPFFKLNGKYYKGKTNVSFLELAEEVKQIYLFATNKKDKEKGWGQGAYRKEVELGRPALFVVYDKKEAHSFGDAKEVKLGNGIKVRYGLVSVGNAQVDVWYIGREELPKYSQGLRNLRVYLSKLHADKEAVRIVLGYLKKNSFNGLDKPKVARFLREILDHLQREKYYGYRNDDFWDIVFKVDQTYDKVSWMEYKRHINTVMEEIKMEGDKIYKLEINGGTFHESTIANKVENMSVTYGAQSQESDGIARFDAALKGLLEQMELTKEQVEALEGQVNVFKNYIQGESPEKGFAANLLNTLKRTFQGLVQNSEGIGQLVAAGESIINLLK